MVTNRKIYKVNIYRKIMGSIPEILDRLRLNFNDPITWGFIGYGIYQAYGGEMRKAVRFALDITKELIQSNYMTSYLFIKEKDDNNHKISLDSSL